MMKWLKFLLFAFFIILSGTASANNATCFGDSYSDPTSNSMSTYAQKYISLVAANNSWNVTNYAVLGTQIQEQAAYIRRYTPSASVPMIWNTGPNNIAKDTDPTATTVYNNSLASLLAWLTIPMPNKLNVVNMTYSTNSWETASLCGRLCLQTWEMGAQITGNITGSTIYVGYYQLNTGGSAQTNKIRLIDIYVDNTYITTVDGHGEDNFTLYNPAVVRLSGLSDTTHTVRIVSNSTNNNAVAVDWVAGINSTTPTNNVYLLNVPLFSDAYYTSIGRNINDTIEYNTMINSTVSMLSEDNRSISVVDIYTGWDVSTMMESDGLHPSHTGNVFMAEKLQLAITNPDFSASRMSGMNPLSVRFTDLSHNSTSWLWDFENDSIIDSTARNPVHTYWKAGNYTVNLTLHNANQNFTTVKSNYITVKPTIFDIIIKYFRWFMGHFTVSSSS